MFYVGLDVHKNYSYSTVMDEGGRVLEQAKIANAKECFRNFFSSLERPVHVAMEATRNWYYLYDIMEDIVDRVHLAHPLKTRAIAHARIKTDKISSSILAHLLRTDLLPSSYIPSKEIRDQKELLRYRASLVGLRTMIKNKVHSLLSKNGLASPYSDPFGKKGLLWLKALPLREHYREALDGYLRLLASLDEEIRGATKRIDLEVKDNPQALLIDTMPGIGRYLALLIASEIGDIHRFPDPKHLVSYAGLVPSVHSSGGITHLGRITKQGSPWLRYAMVEAAQRAHIRKGRLKVFYERIASKHGTKAARVALAREMLIIIYHLLSKNRPYQERRPVCRLSPNRHGPYETQ